MKFFLNRGPELARVDAFVELSGVEAQVGGNLFQALRAQGSLVLEQTIVIIPELSLFVGAKRRFGSRRRMPVIR